MKVYIYCSNCGKKRSFIWSQVRIPNIEKAMKEGWRCSGGLIYCPDCMESREEDPKAETIDRMYHTVYGQLPPRRA